MYENVRLMPGLYGDYVSLDFASYGCYFGSYLFIIYLFFSIIPITIPLAVGIE